MRLSKPPLQPNSNMLIDMDLDFLSDDEAAAVLQERRASSRQASTSVRLKLHPATELCNIPGMLELPTAFGPLFLGEAFQCYVSVINTSKMTVHTVHCKAELESTRARAALYDNGAHTVVLQPGARHDFIIRHDVKDVGQHTLTCSAAYTLPDGERRMLPQNFKFSSSNPLSVRTKSRCVHDMILLEACIENTSRTPLVLDYLRFDPSPSMSATEVRAHDAALTSASGSSHLHDYLQKLKIITPVGGALNLVFQLQHSDEEESANPTSKTGPKELGKLDIKWRTTLGDVGRLQTLPISAPAAAMRDISLQVAQLPKTAKLEVPFLIKVRVSNNTDRQCRDLILTCQEDNAHGSVLYLGVTSKTLAEMGPATSQDIHVQFLALRSGIVVLPELSLTETGKSNRLDTLTISIRVEQ